MSAQRARGADFDTGRLLEGRRPCCRCSCRSSSRPSAGRTSWPWPWRAACYHGGEGRTRMKQLHFARRDYIALLAGALLLAGIITMNVYGL